jgi:hypothetical protein
MKSQINRPETRGRDPAMWPFLSGQVNSDQHGPILERLGIIAG